MRQQDTTSATGGPSFKPLSNVIYHITMLQGLISDWLHKGMIYILNSLDPEISDRNSKIMIFKLIIWNGSSDNKDTS